MNKLFVSTFILFIFSSDFISAQSQFCKTLGSTKDDYGSSIIITKDKGYAVGGGSVSPIAVTDGEDAYLAKLDSNFNLQWTKTIRHIDITDPGTQMFFLSQDNRGQYLTIGYLNNGSTGPFSKIYVTKVDSNGILMWNKVIDARFGLALGLSYGTSGVVTSDGGNLITGFTLNTNTGSHDSDIPLIKLDSSGNLEWSKIIGARGNGNDDEAQTIIETLDGGVALGGSTRSFGSGSWDFYLVKLDSSFNIQWTRTIGGANDERARSLIKTYDGGYAMTGNTYSYSAGGSDIYVVKLDSLGNLQWTRSVGGVNDEFAYSIIQTNDGGYVVVGTTLSYGAGGYDAYIVKLDSNGSLVWTKTIGGTDDDDARSIVQLQDRSFLITGQTNYVFGNGSGDILIAKLDSIGNGCCSVGSGGSVDSGGVVSTGGTIDTLSYSIMSDVSIGTRGTLSTNCVTAIDELPGANAQIKPFVSNDILHLVFESFLPGKYFINIVNILGQQVVEDHRNISNSLPVEFQYTISSYNPGIYFASVWSESTHMNCRVFIK